MRLSLARPVSSVHTACSSVWSVLLPSYSMVGPKEQSPRERQNMYLGSPQVTNGCRFDSMLGLVSQDGHVSLKPGP